MGRSEAVIEINKPPGVEEKKDQLSTAAEKLYNDYVNYPELTVFTYLTRKISCYRNQIERT